MTNMDFPKSNVSKRCKWNDKQWAVCSGSSLFAQTCLSENLGIWRYVLYYHGSKQTLIGLHGYLEGNFWENFSLIRLTAPYFELREKLKCIEHMGKTNTRFCNKNFKTFCYPLFLSRRVWVLLEPDQEKTCHMRTRKAPLFFASLIV